MTQALGEIKVDEMMASLEVSTGGKKNRRAVVFYMDSGKSGNSLLDYSTLRSLPYPTLLEVEKPLLVGAWSSEN